MSKQPSDPAVRAHLLWARTRGLRPMTIRGRTYVLGTLADYAGRPLVQLAADDLAAWQYDHPEWIPQTLRSYTEHVRSFYPTLPVAYLDLVAESVQHDDED